MDFKKQLKLSNGIKTIIFDIVQSSTCHGLPNVFKSAKISIKFMWAFFTILSTGLCAYLISRSIISYFDYEVTTKTRVVLEYTPFFPTVTICNTNYFTSNFSINFIEEFRNNSNPFNPLLRELEGQAKIYVQELEKDKRVFGDSLEKLIVLGEYSKIPIAISKFNYFFHPNYGNCYQFNSGFDQNGQKIDLEKIMVADRLFSLRLLLNISVPSSLKFLNPSSGGLIFIHNHTTYPPLVDPIAISPKTETNIAISRTFYKSQKKPYSFCDGNTDDIGNYDSEYYKIVHKNVKEYSQTLCVYQCLQKHFIDKCNCYVANYPCFYESKPCKLGGPLNCVSEIIISIPKNNLLGNCIEQCPLECEKMSFERLVSYNEFSNSEFEKLLSQTNGSIYFNKSIDSKELVAVNIYYKSLEYKSITENPTIDVVSLFSGIGGVAGLMLGTSVLTLVELVEILMQIFFLIREKRKINTNN